MPEQITHEEAIVPSDALSDADDIADETELSEQTVANVLELVEMRASNRTDERHDLIVVFDDWAFQDWSDYDIVGSKVCLVGHIEDYSEKAYKARGAFEVNMDLIEDRPTEEVKGEYVTDLVEQVDETDEDFIDRIASAFWPKSSIVGIYVVES